jgi:hypothetical protein
MKTTAFKGWREKLDRVIANDALEGVAPLGDRPALLDEDQILELPSPLLQASEIKSVIKAHRSEVKHAFHLRRELDQPSEPDAKGTVRHVTAFDDSKMARFEADMLKKFNDKVCHKLQPSATVPQKLTLPSCGRALHACAQNGN